MNLRKFLMCRRFCTPENQSRLLLLYFEKKKRTRRFRFCCKGVGETKYKSWFRFAKQDFRRLLHALDLGPTYRTRNGLLFTSEEGLHIVLSRLAYPNRLVDLQDIFHRPTSELSFIFNTMIETLYQKFKHLLEEMDHPWMDLVTYSTAIHHKGSPLPNCIGFLDGTLRAVCRPRRDQRELYSGHKRYHGLKFQSVVYPNGIIGNLRGPYPGRRHDCYMLAESGLVDHLDNNVAQFCLYGDSAYPLRTTLMSPYKGANLTAQQKSFNKAMSSLRIAVEWEFGHVVSLFAFLDFKKNLKHQLQPVGKLYVVGVLLKNCYTCLYGSQSSAYFGTDPPPLEDYLYT